MNASEINKQLEETVRKEIAIYPCEHLRCSNIGHPCERYLYLLIKHWEDQQEHDVGLQNIFDLGNSLEEHVINAFKKAGYEVVTPTNRSWRISKPLITGREDIRIKDENGELLPVEIKGLSPFEFDKLNSVEDFFNSKKHYIRAYPAQLQMYMYYFAKEKGFFAILNKLNGAIKIIEMDFDYDYAESLLQKAERIYKALDTDTPPEACDDIAICENCNLQHICGTCKRVPTEIMLNDELDALIKRKIELQPYQSEFKKVDEQIKKIVGENEKTLTGEFLITSKVIHREEYTCPASDYRRYFIKRL